MQASVIVVVILLATMQQGCITPAVGAVGVAQSGYARFPLTPADQGSLDATFLAFREQFLGAIKRRDKAAIVAAVDPALMNGTEPWRTTFEQTLDAPDGSYWRGLERSITLGGSFSSTRGGKMGRSEFCSPYVYSKYPSRRPPGFQGEVEPWVVVGEQVPVLAEPDLKSVVLARMSNELVEVTGEERPGTAPQWYGVVTPAGQDGWVSSSHVRNPEDYHACFANIGGAWFLSDFGRGLPRR